MELGSYYYFKQKTDFVFISVNGFAKSAHNNHAKSKSEY